jgi:hypothetical protein
MTEGDHASHRFLPRIRLELEKLPLTDTQRDGVVPKLLQHVTFLDTAGGQNNFENLRIDSALFDFARKISDVEQRFEPDGMASGDYLHAAVKQPSLFCQSPATIIAMSRLSSTSITRGGSRFQVRQLHLRRIHSNRCSII